MKCVRSTVSLFPIVLSVIAALSAAGCRSLVVTSTAQPSRARVVASGTDVSDSKTFVLPHDWRFGNVTVRKGASITFKPDGRGAFSCTVYGTEPKRDLVALETVQYRTDGKILFVFPSGGAGYFTIPQRYTDFPYDVPFGFDHRQYHHISSVKFIGRNLIEPPKKSHYNEFVPPNR